MLITSTAPDKLLDHVGGEFMIAEDGMEIYIKTWVPETKPKAVILAFHGLGGMNIIFICLLINEITTKTISNATIMCFLECLKLVF